MNKLGGSPIEEMPKGFRTVMQVVQSVLMGAIPQSGVGGCSYTEANDSGCIFRVELCSPADDLKNLPDHIVDVPRQEDVEKMSGGVVFGNDAYFGMFAEIVRATDVLADARGIPAKLTFKELGDSGRPRAGLQIHYPRFKLVFLNGSV